jgi:hypothetical protein
MRRVGILILLLLLSGCFGPDHPDRSRYQYLYVDGTFEPPYTSFPVGAARADWTCFDRKLQKEFSCMMVRGAWEHFQYVYRKRG